jgi:hypothetical protein
MPNCSPKYRDKNGIKNQTRMYISSRCNSLCIHYQACLIELSGGNKEIAPLFADKMDKTKITRCKVCGALADSLYGRYCKKCALERKKEYNKIYYKKKI